MLASRNTTSTLTEAVMSIQSLIFENWTFKACDDQEWLPAKVPGCVHTDLLRLEKIPNPFYGTNEKEV
ncbi:hypothetical protein BZG21_48465, partial [Escherichia coli]|nr:hypothetical protein [Escherichia coli]